MRVVIAAAAVLLLVLVLPVADATESGSRFRNPNRPGSQSSPPSSASPPESTAPVVAGAPDPSPPKPEEKEEEPKAWSSVLVFVLALLYYMSQPLYESSDSGHSKYEAEKWVRKADRDPFECVLGPLA